jgi:hypothetical protein
LETITDSIGAGLLVLSSAGVAGVRLTTTNEGTTTWTGAEVTLADPARIIFGELFSE